MTTMTPKRFGLRLRQLRDRENREGTTAGLAAGALVSLTVLAFFLHTGVLTESLTWAVILSVPITLSLFFTTLTTQLAIRVRARSDALFVHFSGMVGPPIVVFLITCWGALVAAAAGLIAFLVTAPIVIAARRRRAQPGAERLIGATALVSGGAVILLAELAMHAAGIETRVASGWLAVPPAVSAAASLMMVARGTRRHLQRLRLTDLVTRGGVSGVEASNAPNGPVQFVRIDELPGGPHRGAQTRTPIGSLVLAPADATWGGVLIFWSLAVFLGALTLALA